jgi:predicted RNase H-like nuclease
MKIRLIGVDCATDDARVGLALGSLEGARVNVERAVLCTRKDSALATIASWLSPAEEPTLLAIDAPLGWPAPLARALIEHRAGQAIDVLPNDMFRRATDRFIQRELRKTPLDVGADRIARTAHAALRLLGELRGRMNLPIPLAWSPTLSAPLAAIEVYPAATLTSHGFQASGYKAANHTAERDGIIDSLRKVMGLPLDVSVMQASADALDAAVCLLAAADFLRGEAMPPEDQAIAEREGWIWVRAPKRRGAK